MSLMCWKTGFLPSTCVVWIYTLFCILLNSTLLCNNCLTCCFLPDDSTCWRIDTVPCLLVSNLYTRHYSQWRWEKGMCVSMNNTKNYVLGIKEAKEKANDHNTRVTTPGPCSFSRKWLSTLYLTTKMGEMKYTKANISL